MPPIPRQEKCHSARPLCRRQTAAQGRVFLPVRYGGTRGLTSATDGVLPAPGFCDRGFGDCCCRLGRPVAYFDGTLKVFHEPYLPAIRNGSVEPLPDRPGPRAQFERCRDELLPRDLTLLHAAARYTM